MDHEYQHPGELLAQIRAERGLSQTELAKALGMRTSSSLNSYEKNRRPITQKFVTRLDKTGCFRSWHIEVLREAAAEERRKKRCAEGAAAPIESAELLIEGARSLWMTRGDTRPVKYMLLDHIFLLENLRPLHLADADRINRVLARLYICYIEVSCIATPWSETEEGIDLYLSRLKPVKQALLRDQHRSPEEIQADIEYYQIASYLPGEAKYVAGKLSEADKQLSRILPKLTTFRAKACVLRMHLLIPALRIRSLLDNPQRNQREEAAYEYYSKEYAERRTRARIALETYEIEGRGRATLYSGLGLGDALVGKHDALSWLRLSREEVNNSFEQRPILSAIVRAEFIHYLYSPDSSDNDVIKASECAIRIFEVQEQQRYHEIVVGSLRKRTSPRLRDYVASLRRSC